MVAGSSPATNILDILVLVYRISKRSIKILKNYMKKYTKRMISDTDG